METQPALSLAKPFLKWAGGKKQLIPTIEKALPSICHTGQSFTYIEPFVGSGAVLFWMLKTFPQIERAIINDINPILHTTYTAVRDDVELLIEQLQELEADFYAKEESDRKTFFLFIRDEFNLNATLSKIQQAAYMIFLNKTCFNGLFRVNRKNHFNVPFGQYARPNICQEKALMSASIALQKVEILCDDFEKVASHIKNTTFLYFDPPYKPISATALFNAYSNQQFSDSEQQRLKLFCDHLSELGHHWLLSNSDPRNLDAKNDFFDELYKNYTIKRVKARRSINSKGSLRGTINELLIANYPFT